MRLRDYIIPLIVGGVKVGQANVVQNEDGSFAVMGKVEDERYREFIIMEGNFTFQAALTKENLEGFKK